MRAGFVDRLLARVDGEVAPIWISGVCTVDRAPAVGELRAALRRLVDETERLRLAWDERRADLVPAARRDADVERAVGVSPAAPGAILPSLIAGSIDLARDLPVRITVAPRSDLGDGALVAVQVHHALADGRSVLHLVRRLWQLLSGAPGAPLGPPGLGDARALAGAARHLRALPAILRARHRVLARRGQALRRRGDAIGAPMIRSLRVPLGGRFSAEERSGLFFGAVLAGMAAHDRGRSWDAPIRLRVPVDLRRAFGIGPTLENACSAIPVELDGARVRALAGGDPGALAALVPAELRSLVSRGLHFATLLECLVLSRLATTRALRRHAAPDLTAARRASTMVTTYLGSVDRYFAAAPMAIRTFRVHTPTVGANGCCLGDALAVNVTGFEGLWSAADLDDFAGAAAGWLARGFGLRPEVLA
jgi:hypothetical protein